MPAPALKEICDLTDGYTPPPYACATVRALYVGLRALGGIFMSTFTWKTISFSHARLP
jgi:iron-sulfur cluster repair protein YtfE (RIC family)